MDGCPACLVLTPAFTALAMMMHAMDVQVCEALNIHALASESASDADGTEESLQVARSSTEHP